MFNTKKLRLKVYNILAVPSILYGCEIWTLKQSDVTRLKAAEVKFMTHNRIQFIGQ